MVHPGLLVAGVVGTVVTGVVIYAIVKEVLESPMPVGWFERPGRQQGRQRQQQQQFDQDDTDYDRGQSSSVNEGGEYELRRRRRRSSEDELTEEKTSDNDELLERLRKVEESERANAAQASRLEAMERSLLQLQDNLERSMHEQDELRKSIVRNARHEQEIDQNQHPFRSYSPEYNPFAGNQPLIHDYDHDETHHRPASSSSSRISSRPANAILGHNLSNDYQENVNPFAYPSLLANGSASSARSSFHADNFRDAFTDADDRSVTIGNDDEHDWTEAEIGSMGSHDSDESWVSN